MFPSPEEDPDWEPEFELSEDPAALEDSEEDWLDWSAEPFLLLLHAVTENIKMNKTANKYNLAFFIIAFSFLFLFLLCVSGECFIVVVTANF